MIGFLSGKIVNISNDSLIADVRGVGYRIVIGEKVNNLQVGQSVELFIHTHVREDEISLFGFFNQESLELFEMLIAISGIGPKVGMTMVSQIGSEVLIQAIIGEDIKAMKVPGVGRKTSEKVILELKEKLEKKGYRLEKDGKLLKEKREKAESAQIIEAKHALKNLGFRNYEVEEALKDIQFDEGIEVEDLIKKILMYLKK